MTTLMHHGNGTSGSRNREELEIDPSAYLHNVQIGYFLCAGDEKSQSIVQLNLRGNLLWCRNGTVKHVDFKTDNKKTAGQYKLNFSQLVKIHN